MLVATIVLFICIGNRDLERGYTLGDKNRQLDFFFSGVLFFMGIITIFVIISTI